MASPVQEVLTDTEVDGLETWTPDTNRGAASPQNPRAAFREVGVGISHTRELLRWASAVDAWNAALNIYGTTVGPRYQYLESNTICSGPNCINTQIGPVNLSTECAFGEIDADSSTGLMTSSTITFPPESSNWPQAFNDRLAAHELGHHLGLQNNTSSCGAANSPDEACLVWCK